MTSNNFILEIPSNFSYNHAKADGSDLRFVNTSGQELTFFLDKWNPSGTSYVWFKTAVLPNSENEYVWMYYGNPSATAATGQTVEDSMARFGMTTGEDSSSFGTSATFLGTTMVPSRLGNSRVFNDGVSTDVMTITNRSDMSFEYGFSLEVMVKVDTAEADAYVVHKTNGSGEDFTLKVDGLTPKFSFRGVEVAPSATYNLVPGRWEHIVVTYTLFGGECKMYQNGVLTVNSTCDHDSLSSSSTDITIGNNVARNKPFRGEVDEVRFYWDIMSQTRIQSLYASMMLGTTLLTSEQAKGASEYFYQWLSITHDLNDGSIFGGSVYTQGQSNKNFMGYDGGDYWSYFRFQFFDNIPYNAVISKTYLQLMNEGTSTWDESSNYLSIRAEKTDNSLLVSAANQYPDGPAGNTSSINKLLWGFPGLTWSRGFNQSPDLANITQELVGDNWGMSSGNYMTLWVKGLPGDNGYVMTGDYSNGKKLPAKLFIEWK